MSARHLAARSFRSRALDNAAKTYRKDVARSVPGVTWQIVPPREGSGRHRDRSPEQTAADLYDLDMALGRLPVAPAPLGGEDYSAELAEVRAELSRPINTQAVTA